MQTTTVPTNVKTAGIIASDPMVYSIDIVCSTATHIPPARS